MPTRLSSLTEWSQSHIKRVFEAKSDSQCLEAINDTFTPSVKATLNGQSVSPADVKNFVLALRRAGEQNGGSGLRVHWKYALDVPDDPNTNRVRFPLFPNSTFLASHVPIQDGSFGGVYFLSGINMPIPGTTSMAKFERRKIVTVRYVPLDHHSPRRSESSLIIHSRIESQSPDLTVDSRRICNLIFVASNERVDAQEPVAKL
jgi:hypothetical protein